MPKHADEGSRLGLVGRPILDEARLAVDDILERFYYGHDTVRENAADLDIGPDEVESVIRAAWRPAAA